ncbi:MAG TPA: hypothetical protein VMA09_10065 [Candidatus Binataceae bacterium]|nr:hypothetical protein [Candidatus Binataceae bacterium]
MAANNLQFLLFTQRPTYVIQCLQYDIAAQGKSPDEALRSLVSLFRAQKSYDEREGQTPFSTLESTPPEFWAVFEKSWKLEISLDLPPYLSARPSCGSLPIRLLPDASLESARSAIA